MECTVTYNPCHGVTISDHVDTYDMNIVWVAENDPWAVIITKDFYREVITLPPTLSSSWVLWCIEHKKAKYFHVKHIEWGTMDSLYWVDDQAAPPASMYHLVKSLSSDPWWKRLVRFLGFDF